MIFRKSLLAYLFKTLTATSFSRYSRFHTSPNPPRHKGTPTGSLDSSIRSDLGSMVWPAHVSYSDFKHFLRIPGARLGLSDVCQKQKRERKQNQRVIPGDGGTITYLIDDIDKGLGIASSETTDGIGRIPTQEDRFNERGSFALGNGAADQA